MDLQTWKSKQKRTKGFTLIEGLTVLFIASVVIVAFLTVFSQGSTWLLESKNKVVADSIANEKMEMLRNLVYDSIGVSGGIPDGVLLAEEFLERSGSRYRIVTDIRYIDDPHDGIFGGTPNDLLNVDQKQVTITVLWGEEQESQEVRLSTLFVPPGIESLSGAGTLSINTIDSSGSGVGFASVHIVHPEKGIDFSTVTDSNGNILLPGAPESLNQEYAITVSKSGYETVSTFPPYPITAFDPIDEHLSVLEGGLATKVITMNPLANIVIMAVDSRGNSIPNALFSVSGGRILGTQGSYPTATNVYSFSENIETDGSGEYVIGGANPGSYDVALQGATDATYYLSHIVSEEISPSHHFFVIGGSSATVRIFLVEKTLPSLRVMVKNAVDGSALSDVSVRLHNATLGYDETILTTKNGIALFPNSSTDLTNDTYTLSVSATGFESKSESVTINNFTQQEIGLTAS